jgi:hypothetical protein
MLRYSWMGLAETSSMTTIGENDTRQSPSLLGRCSPRFSMAISCSLMSSSWRLGRNLLASNLSQSAPRHGTVTADRSRALRNQELLNNQTYS